MPILQTAKDHFNNDLARARGLMISSAAFAPPNLVVNPLVEQDMLRAALMFSVGACDAYFADAYADLISRSLRAKELEPSVAFPDRLNNLRMPVTAILRPTAIPGWRWRMAARELVEKENVLSFGQIRGLFNQFFPANDGILSRDRVLDWMGTPGSKDRQFGISAKDLAALPISDQNKAKNKAAAHFEKIFISIFQRRHDCIHCCDRPKSAIQAINKPAVQKKIYDVAFLVDRCHDELVARFGDYLKDLGFSAATRNQVMV